MPLSGRKQPQKRKKERARGRAFLSLRPRSSPAAKVHESLRKVRGSLRLSGVSVFPLGVLPKCSRRPCRLPNPLTDFTDSPSLLSPPLKTPTEPLANDLFSTRTKACRPGGDISQQPRFFREEKSGLESCWEALLARCERCERVRAQGRPPPVPWAAGDFFRRWRTRFET